MGSVYMIVFFASESTPISFFKLNRYNSYRDINKIHLLHCHQIAPLVSKYPPLRSFPNIDWVANQPCHDKVMNIYYEINIASAKSKDTNTSSITMNGGSSKYLEILNDR